ncbi:protein KASH5 isoform X3 [Agelaius tricolor]|uniref:protein KASH5 isoform X3 n=1 Tax=Agelaius tricolor TaxID=9191 RepID=UPI0039F1DF72
MAAELPCAPGAAIPLPGAGTMRERGGGRGSDPSITRVPPSAPAESGCSDEFALDCTFAACDPERTGLVQPQRVVEYVAAMTGHSGHDGRLRALQRALDPAAAGTALDWSRFRSAMGAWIAACRQDGSVPRDRWARCLVPATPASGADPQLRPCRAEEQDMATGDTGAVPAEDEGHASPAAAQLQGDNTDATSPSAEAAGLRSRTRQLAAQNAKLQRDAELAEELNARLAEEIAQLQAQLRSRQALEQARAAVEELDDMKAVVKRLEEENTELRRQARHTEKEQRSLCSRAEGLQEEVSLVLRAAPVGQCHREPSPVSPLAEPAAPRRGPGTAGAAPGTGGSRGQPGGPALPWNCPALCTGRSPCPGERCPVTLPPPQLSPGPPPALSHGPSRPGPVPQAGQRAQELTAALEEYERMVQELRLETTRLRQQLGQMRDAWAMRPWCPRGQLELQATATASPGTGDKEEDKEEDAGTGGGDLEGSPEEVAKAVAPQAPLSPWTPLLSPWALALLALLALLYLLPRQLPQPQLRHRSPPPL